MSTGDIAGFITARLDERQKEMQQHAAIQIMAGYPRHGMAHFEYEAFQELLRGVEAKRRLLVRYERAVAAGDSHPSTYARGQDDGYRQACLDAIRDECSVYADHPDYRPDWSL